MSKRIVAESINNGVCDSIHERQNNYPLWSYRKDDILRRVPTDRGYYSLGHFSSSLDLCPSSSKRDGIGKTDRIFNGKSGTDCTIFDGDTDRFQTPPFNSERNILEGDAGKMHVRCFNSLPSASERRVSEIKGEVFEDSRVGSGCGKCSNSESIGRKLAPFGKLLRVTSLGSNARTQSGERCRFIFAHSHFAQETSAIKDQTTMPQMSVRNGKDGSPSISDNLSILVDTFENKSRIATFIGRKILTNSEPEDLTEYIECIAEFGFNHVIIIGEVDFGMIFLDCFERVFKWDDESQILWPLGKLKDQPKYLKKEGDWLGWIVQNGTVHEHIRKPLCTIFPDLYVTAKNDTKF